MNLTRLGGALLAATLLFAVTGVAGAHPATSLTLTVIVPEGAVKSVRLTCAPPGGTHPNAKRACAEIRAAGGSFDSLPGKPVPTICTMEYLPVTAVAEGTWRGRPVHWQQVFGNHCVMHNETGTVFLF